MKEECQEIGGWYRERFSVGPPLAGGQVADAVYVANLFHAGMVNFKYDQMTYCVMPSWYSFQHRNCLNEN